MAELPLDFQEPIYGDHTLTFTDFMAPGTMYSRSPYTATIQTSWRQVQCTPRAPLRRPHSLHGARYHVLQKPLNCDHTDFMAQGIMYSRSPSTATIQTSWRQVPCTPEAPLRRPYSLHGARYHVLQEPIYCDHTDFMAPGTMYSRSPYTATIQTSWRQVPCTPEAPLLRRPYSLHGARYNVLQKPLYCDHTDFMAPGTMYSRSPSTATIQSS